MVGRHEGRYLAAAGLALAGFVVAGCQRSEAPQPSDRVITDYVQQPLDRARAIEQQQAEAAQARQKAMDEAANQ